MSIVTLEQAKRHLQIWTAIGSPLDDVDEDIALKLAQAEAIIADYIKQYSLDAEDLVVQAAVLLQLAELMRFRGDDPSSSTTSLGFGDGQLSPTITALLRRRRDPTLA
jgi:hypothetical protein